MKKFAVDSDKCIGCGACVAIDNTHFDFNDDGLSHVINNENIDEAQANDIVDVCPTGAIKYEELDDNECRCMDGEECTCGDECHCGEDCSCGDECPCHNEE